MGSGKFVMGSLFAIFVVGGISVIVLFYWHYACVDWSREA